MIDYDSAGLWLVLRKTPFSLKPSLVSLRYLFKVSSMAGWAGAGGVGGSVFVSKWASNNAAVQN